MRVPVLIGGDAYAIPSLRSLRARNSRKRCLEVRTKRVGVSTLWCRAPKPIRLNKRTRQSKILPISFLVEIKSILLRSFAFFLSICYNIGNNI